MGNGNFRPPTESILLNLSPKNLLETPTAVPNLVHIRPWGLLREWVKYSQILFIYLFRYLFILFWELTYRSDLLRMIAQTARTRARMCLLGFVDMAPRFAV